MSDNGEKQVSTAEAQQPQPAKKPYVAPKLRHLGSVRELTYGTDLGGQDGAGIPGRN